MNLTMMRRAADYLLKLCVKGSTTPEQIDFYPQKPRSAATCTPPPLPPRVSPESVGISSAYMERFLHALEDDPQSRMHNLLIYRRGKPVVLASAPGYSPRIWSLTHSMAKTVTSFAVACLIGDGRLHLDTRLTDVFADELPPLVSLRTRKITVRHLLTMTAGVTGVNEVAAVTLTDWKRAFLSCPPAFSPGKRFYYNSINSYMLGAVVEKISGRSLEAFLGERLFAPLGITEYLIEKSPEGTAKSGWGMYLTPLDMAKLGQLVLDGGMWQGRQILPADYLREATGAAVHTTEAYGDYDYGYHMWVARDGSAVLFNGMLGQNVWICPENELVVVSTAGNGEFYQLSTTLRLVARYFGGGYRAAAGTLLPNPLALARLRRAEQNFFCRRHGLPENGRHTDLFRVPRRRALPARTKAILGEYEVEKNNVGLMPLIWRAMQNNHSKGISRVAFRIREGRFYIALTEGEERELACGFNAYAYTELDYRGEKILAGVMGAFVQNEDGEEVFRVDVVFPELPNSRRMKFYFHGDTGRMAVALSETPGADMPYSMLGSLSANMPWLSVLLDIVRNRLGTSSAQLRVLHCMEPVLYGVREDAGMPPSRGEEAAAAVRRGLQKGLIQASERRKQP